MKSSIPSAMLLFSLATAYPIVCQCQSNVTGWIYNKTADFHDGPTTKLKPQHTTIKLSGNRIEINQNCFIRIEEKSYTPSSPFQLLIKTGANEGEINNFVETNFKINLQDTKTYYNNIEKWSTCNNIGNDLIISGDKLLVVDAGTLFHEYKRTFTSIVYDPSRSLVNLSGLNVSPLPFDLKNFFNTCQQKMWSVKGIPQPTNKCEPTYYPHVATRQSTDWLSKLVGSYEYHKNGADHAQDDYDNPVANGLHPIFFILPPMNDVVVVRVDDLEFSENRDAMSGTYLSIKNKKIVDILSDGCSFDVSYTCSGTNPDRKFQLQPNGRFKRIQ